MFISDNGLFIGYNYVAYKHVTFREEQIVILVQEKEKQNISISSVAKTHFKRNPVFLLCLMNYFDAGHFVLILECSDHFYGSDCNTACGHCSNNDVCDKENGRCQNGCQSYWAGEKCDGRELPEGVKG